MNDMYDGVYLNEYGYYALKSPPPREDLEMFYKERYHPPHPDVYTDEERAYMSAKLEQKLLLIKEHGSPRGAFLDIGCGKGFALDFFDRHGFEVLGLDFSETGIEQNNPRLKDRLVCGDVSESVMELAKSGGRFSVVNMDNVLEHLLDPLGLLCSLRPLLDENGVVLVKVPNDFSAMQSCLVNAGIVAKPRWVVSGPCVVF